MMIFHGRQAGTPSQLKSATFTGTVHADPVMPSTDGVVINNVFFSPGARTYWHTHETGQILTVTAGKGWVCMEGEAAQELKAGDTVWIAKDEKHWHGAAEDSFLLHTAISLGKTEWLEEVAETDYPTAAE